MILNKISNKIIVALLYVAINQSIMAQVSLIPYPNSLEEFNDSLVVKDIKVKYDKALENEFCELRDFMQESGVEVVSVKKKYNINLKLNEESCLSCGEEGYILEVNKKNITITSNKPAGVFYGIQTLKQLVNISSQSKVTFPSVKIKDNPKFKWRAFMLDESRHFKGKNVVFNLLDQMALLKMNVFHWHLTDDQGWRIEIKKYPLLTKIGGYRKDTQINSVKSTKSTGKPHSGFYTQEDIKEVIAYAKTKHITIIPEIEMPGHASAAIAAYPWLGVNNKRIDVPSNFGVLKNIFNVSDPKTIMFLKDVLQEVIDLFPSKIVHIGGDEVKFDQWKESGQMTSWMKEHKISSYPDVQIAFTNKMSKFIESKNHRMMGWNDVLGEKLHHYNDDFEIEKTQKLAKSTIIHFWKGSRDLMISALKKGHEVVNSQHNFTYLDYDYNSIPIEKAYSFSPIPEGIDESLKSQVLGLGCQMWSEWIPEIKDLYRQVFPRIAAYAEVGWTNPENKSIRRFLNSLEKVKQNWEDTPYYKNKG